MRSVRVCDSVRSLRRSHIGSWGRTCQLFRTPFRSLPRGLTTPGTHSNTSLGSLQVLPVPVQAPSSLLSKQYSPVQPPPHLLSKQCRRWRAYLGQVNSVYFYCVHCGPGDDDDFDFGSAAADYASFRWRCRPPPCPVLGRSVGVLLAGQRR